MLAWLTFVSMALLVSAPIAVAFKNRARMLLTDQPAILAFWSAFLAFAAVIGGLVARSQLTVDVMSGIEVALMLCAGGSICIGLLSIGHLRSAGVRMIAVVGVVIVFIAAYLTRSNGQSAGAIAWMTATVCGLVVAIGRRSLAGRHWTASPTVALAFAFLSIHLAQLAQIIAGGQLKAAVPAVSIIVMAAIAALITDRVVRRAAPAYARSGLGEASAHRLFQSVERLMAERKLYVRPELRREHVAVELGVTPRLIGEAINRCTNDGFAAYLRRLRAAEADRLLADPVNRTVALEALGMQAGFQSRSVFYAAFVEAFGLSPGERRAGLPTIVSARSG